MIAALTLLSSLALAAPTASTCTSGAGVLVHVSGFNNGRGTVRVQAYGPDPKTFLEKGKWVRRVEVPLNGRRSLDVCLPLASAGRYAIAVRHDANASGKSDWNDGGGFSRNPKLSLLRLKPKFDQAAISVDGIERVAIVLNYRRGLSIGPVSGNTG